MSEAVRNLILQGLMNMVATPKQAAEACLIVRREETTPLRSQANAATTQMIAWQVFILSLACRFEWERLLR